MKKVITQSVARSVALAKTPVLDVGLMLASSGLVLIALIATLHG
jgi:hypothetical protein